MRDGFKLFDVHSHIGTWGRWEMKGNEVEPFENELTSREKLRHHMERYGIDRQIVMPHYHPSLRRTFELNPLALELSEMEGVYSGVFFEPAHDRQTKAALDMAESPEVKVLKTSAGAWQNDYDPDSWSIQQEEVMDRVMEKAGREGLIVQLHTGYGASDPVKIFRMIDRYPEVTYHLVHMGGVAGGHFALLPRLLDRLDMDIYVDTSWSRGFAPRWFARELKERNALDRMMFATDYPWGDFHSEFHKVTGLGILEGEEKQMVLHHNAHQLYD